MIDPNNFVYCLFLIVDWCSQRVLIRGWNNVRPRPSLSIKLCCLINACYVIVMVLGRLTSCRAITAANRSNYHRLFYTLRCSDIGIYSETLYGRSLNVGPFCLAQLRDV